MPDWYWYLFAIALAVNAYVWWRVLLLHRLNRRNPFYKDIMRDFDWSIKPRRPSWKERLKGLLSDLAELLRLL